MIRTDRAANGGCLWREGARKREKERERGRGRGRGGQTS